MHERSAPDDTREDMRPTPGVAIRTLGCKVNQVESEQIAADLLASGFRLVAEQDADLIVVNTCTVTGEADAKARKLVRRELQRPRKPIVLVTGCLVATDRSAVEELGAGLIALAEKERVAEMAARSFGMTPSPQSRSARIGDGFHTRAMVKVQDGCDNFCSYCIVPSARGLPRSVPFDDILREVDELVQMGAAEIVLTGVNLGRYESAGAGLARLVAAVASAGARRVRLSSIEPPDLSDELLDTLASTTAFAPHLHVPLQSGSDHVLKAMGRRYTLPEYAARLSAARKAIPGLAVTTDVICGFPGETDEDASETLCACDELTFARLHVFRFSARAGTRAASMPGQIAPEVRSARAASLRRLDALLRRRYANGRVGGRAVVLVESAGTADDAAAYATGTSGDYLKVRIEDASLRVGELVDVTLREVAPEGSLLGGPNEVSVGFE